jgi:hypothetical protein
MVALDGSADRPRGAACTVLACTVLAYAVVAVLMATAAPVLAHHSIAGVYDSTASITLDGVVSEFRFVNPHPFVILTVDRNGRPETWKLELDNRYELADVGMKADTLKPGDRLVARGSTARDGSHAIYVLRMDRSSDRFWYEQVASSPRVGRGPRR